MVVFLMLLFRVGLRYIFRIGVIWLNPLISIIFLWVAILSISVMLKRKGHIAVDYFKDLIPSKRIKHVIYLIIYSVSIFAFLVLAISSINIIPVHAQRDLVGSHFSRANYSFAILYLAVSCLITSIYFFFCELKEFKKSFGYKG